MTEDEAEAVEEEIAPTAPLSGWVLLSDLFSNVGTVIDHIATIPNDVSLRIQGHLKHKHRVEQQREELFTAIQGLEDYANDGE